MKSDEDREKDFKRNHGIAIRPKIEIERKCFVCKEPTTKYLGVSGKWGKEWNYCKEHYMSAKVERDSFLVSKKHEIYDKCKYHEDIVEEYRAKGEAKNE